MRDWIIAQTYVHVREKGVRVPRLEGVIAENGEASYFYALRVLHGRFERGEPAIASIPKWAVKYARFIIRRRFEIAEENLCSDPELCYEYFRYVTCGKLPGFMHNAMVMMSFEKPDDYFVLKYFKEIT
jgi:hypothetical protein